MLLLPQVLPAHSSHPNWPLGFVVYRETDRIVPRLLSKHIALTGCDDSATMLESQSPLFKVGDDEFGMVSSKLKLNRGLGTVGMTLNPSVSFAPVERPVR